MASLFLKNLLKPKSIAYKLFIYFLVSGVVFLTLVLAGFLTISNNFANLAVESSMGGMIDDIEEFLEINDQGHFQTNDEEINMQWGFDALYSNLGYRLVDKKDLNILYHSNRQHYPNALIEKLPLNLPLGYSNLSDIGINAYRADIEINGSSYYLDVGRSDLLGQLANEAVIPAIIEVSTTTMAIALILFIVLNIFAIRLIVRPVQSVSRQLSSVHTDNLSFRLDTKDIPLELLPISKALNSALERVEKGVAMQKRFVADAAHELRTPLTIHRNRIELKLDDHPVRQDLLKDSDYMSRIVEQLLDLSRAQNRENSYQEQVKISDVIKECCLMLAPLAIKYEKELELACQPEHAQYSTVGDTGELTVAFKNLIENAIKHSANGIQVIVTVKDNMVCIEDSGPGITEDDKDNIFERFWRKNSSDLSGSGLGLSIAKEVFTNHQASLTVERSERLQGAKITVEFNA